MCAQDVSKIASELVAAGPAERESSSWRAPLSSLETEEVKRLLEQNIAEYREFMIRAVRGMIPQQVRRNLNPSDVVHETFHRAYAHISTAAPANEAQLRGWLCRILLNTLRTLIRNELRRRPRGGASFVSIAPATTPSGSRDPATGPRARDPSPGSWIDSLDRLAALNRAFDDLSEAEERAFLLKYCDDLRMREIAARMERSVVAVTSLIQRALSKLRDRLGEDPRS